MPEVPGVSRVIVGMLTVTGMQTSSGNGVARLKSEVGALLAQYEHYSSGVVRLEVRLPASQCLHIRIMLNLSIHIQPFNMV